MTESSVSEFQARTEQLDRLVQRVNDISDGDARATAFELLQSAMDLHGAVVSRIVEVLSETEAGRTSLTKLGNDPLITGLLVLYGVHPVSMEERIARAIEKVRPQLQKHGGGVDLLGINDGVVRVSIQSTGNGCHSSPDSLKESVQQAVLEAAPDVVEIVAEGVPASGSGFVPLDMIQPAA
jgi:Fe-S cluster biogenesis protein NfuA